MNYRVSQKGNLSHVVLTLFDLQGTCELEGGETEWPAESPDCVSIVYQFVAFLSI